MLLVSPRQANIPFNFGDGLISRGFRLHVRQEIWCFGIDDLTWGSQPPQEKVRIVPLILCSDAVTPVSQDPPPKNSECTHALKSRIPRCFSQSTLTTDTSLWLHTPFLPLRPRQLKRLERINSFNSVQRDVRINEHLWKEWNTGREASKSSAAVVERMKIRDFSTRC